MSLTTVATDTPMLRQFKEIKAQCTDAILFFRLGDFYEMFLDDAITASRELELTLTGRGKDESRIPMCGVPHHAAENYISKLVSRGYKVAICEQTEDPTASKGITKREIVRIITPGTVIDQNQLEEKTNNYLAAIIPLSQQRYGIAFTDLSTGEFKVTILPNQTELDAQLERLAPKEILTPENITLPLTIMQTPYYPIDAKQATHNITQHFNVAALSSFGLEGLEDALPAAWAILHYAKKTQLSSVSQITRLLPYSTEKVMFMDRATIRNLELTEPLHKDAPKKATLFGVLDFCKTSMGARHLKNIIKSPYTDITCLTERLDAVQALKNDRLSREEIRTLLDQIYDIERLMSRIMTQYHHPKDCIALKQSLKALTEMPQILHHLDNAQLLQKYAQKLTELTNPSHPCQQLIAEIEAAIIDPPPTSSTEGNLIKPGYSKELDELVGSFHDIKQWISNLESEEREKSGIKSLKIGYNKVFGYYIEITHTHQHLVPENYIRKQTLTNAERYITPEMKEKETILLTAEDQQKKLESQLYQTLIEKIRPHIQVLQNLATLIADLDCLQSLATAAEKYNYTRPTITNNPQELSLENARHPVLEQQIGSAFIPNTLHMSKIKNRFILITGPNMAGKSTVMKQVALIAIMAQIGSFVPADKATLSLTDKLFTRIGATDNLYSGQSTFMVEMLETATIVNNATENSLVILDEIGRGTATFDGMSIACAVAEYIHRHIRARTFFATHYHELTILESKYPELANFTMKITEINGKLVFNHQLIPGPADKSYGIHVAEMAGLPNQVIHTAKTHLTGFEAHGADYLKKTARDTLFPL